MSVYVSRAMVVMPALVGLYVARRFIRKLYEDNLRRAQEWRVVWDQADVAPPNPVAEEDEVNCDDEEAEDVNVEHGHYHHRHHHHHHQQQQQQEAMSPDDVLDAGGTVSKGWMRSAWEDLLKSPLDLIINLDVLVV